MQYYKSDHVQNDRPQKTSILNQIPLVNKNPYTNELTLREKLQVYFAKDGYQSATILGIYTLQN